MTDAPQRWRLDDLLPAAESPEMEAFIDGLLDRVRAFEETRSALTSDLSIERFSEILTSYERLYADISILAAYSYLWFSEDTGNEAARSFRARANQIAADIENRTLFFTLWWKQLSNDIAGPLLQAAGDVRYYLESLRRFTPHTLSEAEERIINIKNLNGIQSILTLYDMLTTGLEFRLTIDGKERLLTRGELMAYVSDPSPELRAAAYQELLRRFNEHQDLLGEMYAARVRDWSQEQVRLRGFTNPISARNLANDIPDAATDTLLQVVRDNRSLFQRFFTLKARALGSDRLHRYDLYAPLSNSDRQYTFDEAIQLVDESYRAFSPTLADQAQRVLAERHLDAQVRPRKMSGAYCYAVLPGLTPWVLTNYGGKIRDVSTLAHELGHAVHALLAADHSVLTFHASLPMAETASVFGEMLLTDHLLARERDPDVKKAILGTVLDDAYATIMRQAYFVLFERTAHEMVVSHATSRDLKQAYLDNLREQFGEAVEVSDDFALEWLAIPHIYHTPFYCYAYAFGNLLVLSLYREYQRHGTAFEPTYLKILSYGGSASPAAIITEAGFDMTTREFWQSGFDLLEEMLDELEQLVIV